MHKSPYLCKLKEPSEGVLLDNAFEDHSEYFKFTKDTYQNVWTYNCALQAAGGVIEAIDSVVKGEVNNAFCCVRPPGHHAYQSLASGFCFINNVAVGA